MKKLLAIFLTTFLCMGALCACGKDALDPLGLGSTEEAENGTPIEVDFSKTDSDMFTERDSKTAYDTSNAIEIKLNGSSATASSNSVKISGSTITITENKTHIISGTLNNGSIVVNAPESAKLQLVFNGVTITNEKSAALSIVEADKVFITLAKGTKNTLSTTGDFASSEDNIDGTLFSKQDLTLNGEGTLVVNSVKGHGIVCKDDLVFTSGTYEINSASHGIDANDSVRISKANITIDAGKDGIHAENNEDASLGFVYVSSGTIKAEAEGDGISAGAYIQIAGGKMTILAGGGSENGTKEHSDSFGGFQGGPGGGGPTGGGRPRTGTQENATTEESTEDSSTSMKGIKAANSILISDGTITIDSADDSVHSNASLVINGGTLALAAGDDAIHAEETLSITAGKIEITESYEGLEALHIVISGGNIKLVASDDGLNAAGGTDQSGTEGGRDGMFGGGRPGGGMSSGNGSIKISGGTLYVKASGDGIDANGTLEITGGNTTVCGPTQGDTATLDYDKTATISGGTFIGTGASGMAQSFSDSKQGVVAVSVGNQSAGTKITLKNSDGKTIITHTPELDFAVVILSSPDIKTGEDYTITVGSQSATFEAQ